MFCWSLMVVVGFASAAASEPLSQQNAPQEPRAAISVPDVRIASPVPSSLRGLVESSKKLAAIRLESRGELRIEAVRQRMGALSALAGMAKVYIRGKNVEHRLWAHWIVADAHQTFAAELSGAKAPDAAQKEAWKAWVQQLDSTLEQMVRTSRAHLRSCESLAQGSHSFPEIGEACRKRLEKSDPKIALAKEDYLGKPSAVAQMRMDELQGCHELLPGGNKTTELKLKASVSLDELGRVEAVAVTPRLEKQAALQECIDESLWLWVFPGVADAELEIPIWLKGRSPE